MSTPQPQPEDDFVRITLRIPTDLHAQLTAAAAKKRSMNAEIIARLEKTFDARSGVAVAAATDLVAKNFANIKSPYYADHYLLLLGPVMADYLMSVGQYESFIRNDSDTLLRMDYKNETQRMAAKFLARDHIIKAGAKFPAFMDEDLFAASKRLSENRRYEEEIAAQPQKSGRRSMRPSTKPGE